MDKEKRSQPPEPLGEDRRSYEAELASLVDVSAVKAEALLSDWVQLFVDMLADHRSTIGRKPDPGAPVPPKDPSAPYLAYMSGYAQTGPGRPGWKLRFAWACATDGFDPKRAALFEDAAVRSTAGVRETYEEWLVSDPGHREYVLKRWTTTFRSLFDGLAAADQAVFVKHHLPRADDWIGSRDGGREPPPHRE